MIESVIEWSIRNRYVVILASIALAVAGVRAMLTTPVDAIPDLSENQVIVFTDWMGRGPQEIEDQVTYPLSVNLQGLAGVGFITLTIAHVYFAIRPEKLPITASMIVGSMSREFYLKEHDPTRWVVAGLSNDRSNANGD